MWLQRTLDLSEFGRGCHLITSQIVAALPELREVAIGMLHVFIQHTSASLSLNENADPDVRADLSDALDRLVPEGAAYRHDAEGADDMPAHIKASLMGSALMIPISKGQLALGRWQGIYLCEHRIDLHRRRLVLTVNGE